MIPLAVIVACLIVAPVEMRRLSIARFLALALVLLFAFAALLRDPG